METVRLDREISQTTAPGGVIVLSERVPSVRSVAVGIWVRSASAHEPRPKMGVSHLLEHMVFKGTERRTAQQIALALESRGGSLDAYTSRDTTAFGAFIEILPGVEGLLHISELQHGRTERTEDVVKKGDHVRVKLLEVDERGRMRLSRKALLEKPEAAPARSH